ncbi:Mitochondrial import inner membrane translocase subunit tim8 [Rhizopus stolonifer]|uniref:Mitochondrial import inner membrane translocase subunit tim8 n=1 Tax=Rhizopus stolonifer TaxID=4846 RepID=A0A367KJP0_RHIST|nr:Mitochondrial import inner membrane translocase subunit tim8 [Rhizopus stolonifer]
MSQPQFTENDQHELGQFLQVEQAKARVQQTVHSLTDTCWDKCISKVNNKLERGEEACLANCVERFLDTSMFIVKRLEQLRSNTIMQHPLGSEPTPTSTKGRYSIDSLPPIPDDDLSSFPTRRVSSPIPHNPDSIVRAQSPFGKRYLKPINGIQTKGFARSAQRRSSVLTLGSIERLQNFYAKKDLKVNKTGTLGFRNTILVEEPDDDDDQLPTPQAPPPTWIDLDVETDLDVLLSYCFQDIQNTLATWSMITGPHRSSSSSSTHPLATDSEEEQSSGTFQILPLLQTVTKMLSSVKNYTVNRHDLSDEALSRLRHASLDLLEAMKVLENQYRVSEEEGHEEGHGYLYRLSDFSLLEKERQAIHNYLDVVEKYAFNPPHHIGSPPAMFTPEIQALLGKTQILSLTEEELVEQQEKSATNTNITTTTTTTTKQTIPEWLERGSFTNDPMGRYHALIIDNLDGSLSKEDVPDPKGDEDAFLQFLADGIALCNVYNSLVKRSKRPFGLIAKIHNDSRRTYRAIENLRFFSAACKFRFELIFDEFDPSEIARKTDKGLNMIKKTLTSFCDCVIREFREQVDSVKKQTGLK